MGALWATVVLAAIVALHRIAWSPTAPDGSRLPASDGRQRGTGFQPRASLLDAAMLLGGQLILVAVLAFTHAEGGWSGSTVGVSTHPPHWMAFLAGIVVYPCFLLAAYLAARILGHAGHFDHIAFLAMRQTWPRSRLAKTVTLIASCVLNPVTEEILYRGILIALFGLLLGSYLPAVTVGLVLTLGAHRYQGLRALPYHAIFFAFATLVLFSPLGLVGAIGLHFAADLWPQLRWGASVDLWRRHLKSRAIALPQGRNP